VKELECENDLVLFLGAGMSKPVGIPDMYEFVNEFKNKMGKKESELLNQIINNEKIDLEELLRRLHKLSGLLDDKTYLRMLSPKANDITNLSQTKKLKEELMNFVYDRCSNFDKKTAHQLFKRLYNIKELFECEQIKIFTTNYDICAETCFEDSNIPYTTGFKLKGTYPVWDTSIFKDPAYNVHIYKIHGSITWYKYGDQIVQLPPFGRQLPTQRGKQFKVQMIYPLTGKEMFESPYSELQYHLQKVLTNCSLCIIIGYSFRDESIISIFENALRENEELSVLIIDLNANDIVKKFSNTVQKISNKIEEVTIDTSGFYDFMQIFITKLNHRMFKKYDLARDEKLIKFSKRCLQLALKLGNMLFAGNSSTILSLCYKDLKDKGNMEKYAKKSIEYYNKLVLKSGDGFNNLGIVYSILGDSEKSKEYYKNASEAYKKEGKEEEIRRLRTLIE